MRAGNEKEGRWEATPATAYTEDVEGMDGMEVEQQMPNASTE